MNTFAKILVLVSVSCGAAAIPAAPHPNYVTTIVETVNGTPTTIITFSDPYPSPTETSTPDLAPRWVTTLTETVDGAATTLTITYDSPTPGGPATPTFGGL